MVTIRARHPLQFFFECPECGTYRVSEETLRSFITAPLENRLEDVLREGATGAVLKFESGCPVCRPNSRQSVSLSALRIVTEH